LIVNYLYTNQAAVSLLAFVLASWNKLEILTMQKRIYYNNKQGQHLSAEKQKFTFRDVLVIALGWLFALAMVYICYLKFKFFLHH